MNEDLPVRYILPVCYLFTCTLYVTSRASLNASNLRYT